MSKKTKDDLRLIKSQRIINPDKALDLRFLNYDAIKFRNRLSSKIYDDVFTFLYESEYYYSKILNYIDSLHQEYGYITPIPYGLVARVVGITTEEATIAIHHMRRKGIILEYKSGIMRLRCINATNKVYKRILSRHPSITPDKPLGYNVKK